MASNPYESDKTSTLRYREADRGGRVPELSSLDGEADGKFAIKIPSRYELEHGELDRGGYLGGSPMEYMDMPANAAFPIVSKLLTGRKKNGKMAEAFGRAIHTPNRGNSLIRENDAYSQPRLKWVDDIQKAAEESGHWDDFARGWGDGEDIDLLVDEVMRVKHPNVDPVDYFDQRAKYYDRLMNEDTNRRLRGEKSLLNDPNATVEALLKLVDY